MPSGESNPTLTERVRDASQTALAELREAPTSTEGAEDKAAASQAPAMEKLPEWVSDLDLSDLSAEAKAKVIEKTKRLDGDYRRKTADIARERDALDSQKQEVMTLVESLKANATKTDLATKVTSKQLFEQWVEQEPDPGNRERIRQLRDAVRQEAGGDRAEKLEKKLAEMESVVKQMAQGFTLSRQDQVRAGLRNLPSSYQSLVEKHEKALLELGLQFPNLSPKKLLQLQAGDDEYETAVAAEQTRQTKTKAPAKPAPTPHAAVGGEGATAPTVKPKSPWFGPRHDMRALVGKFLGEARRGG